MEVYAAMIDRMDQGIGKIVAELRKSGPARQHADPLPAGQRRLRESDGGTGNRRHPNGRGPTKPTLPPMKPRSLQPMAASPMQTRDGFPVRMGDRGHARARRTPTSPTARAGRTCGTRRSASTSTGSTRGASARR